MKFVLYFTKLNDSQCAYAPINYNNANHSNNSTVCHIFVLSVPQIAVSNTLLLPLHPI